VDKKQVDSHFLVAKGHCAVVAVPVDVGRS